MDGPQLFGSAFIEYLSTRLCNPAVADVNTHRLERLLRQDLENFFCFHDFAPWLDRPSSRQLSLSMAIFASAQTGQWA
jgi:hypothetical protein